MPPLKGIVHAAGVLDDGILTQQTAERFESVMAPKAAGAWNLHQLTEQISLDFFVMFSSVTAPFGSPGQGNYAAANAFLDGLAHYRAAQGLPALSINWGPWSQIGLAAQRHEGGLQGLKGLQPLTPTEALEVLRLLLQSDYVQVVVTGIDPVAWCQAHPSAERSYIIQRAFVRNRKTRVSCQSRAGRTSCSFASGRFRTSPADDPDSFRHRTNCPGHAAIGRAGRCAKIPARTRHGFADDDRIPQSP